VELVSHDLGKYLRLLVKNNGYVLEQVFSPLVVLGDAFLARLRPIAGQCITRHVYHHYRGFLQTQQKLLERQEPKKVKTVLYAYRVVLTGIHLLRTGEVEANLSRLAPRFSLDFLDELIRKKSAGEWAPANLDWNFHREKLGELEEALDRAHQESTLPEELPRSEVNEFLVRERLGRR
jgi:predicted nucleotidyltransferase